MINLNMINLNSSNIINEQLGECYEQFLCVKYEDGSWWHYRQTETGYEWW